MVAFVPFFRAVMLPLSVIPVNVPPTARLNSMKKLSWK